MNKKIIALLALVALFASPTMVFAELSDGAIPSTPTGSIEDFLDLLDPILNLMWQIFIALAFIMILIAAFLFITANGDPGKLQSARQALIWAAVAVGVGLVAFSIPRIIAGLFGGGY